MTGLRYTPKTINAESKGFEPLVQFPIRMFSKHVLSASQATLQLKELIVLSGCKCNFPPDILQGITFFFANFFNQASNALTLSGLCKQLKIDVSNKAAKQYI